ncbi:hypothetical protein [Azospirillum endophyticum]
MTIAPVAALEQLVKRLVLERVQQTEDPAGAARQAMTWPMNGMAKD